jgi:hypothetical protein
MDSAAGSTSAAPSTARRLENAQLNKSLDEIIRDNRKTRKAAHGSGPNKNKAQKLNQKPGQGQKQVQGQKQTHQQKQIHQQKQKPAMVKSASVTKFQKQSRPSAVLPKTSNLRQPWEKPAQLPRAPIPVEPLKISIRNEHADRVRASYMMDVDGDRPGNSHYRSDRDAVGVRSEYRMGGRSATEPMQIDYQFSRRR